MNFDAEQFVMYAESATSVETSPGLSTGCLLEWSDGLCFPTMCPNVNRYDCNRKLNRSSRTGSSADGLPKIVFNGR